MRKFLVVCCGLLAAGLWARAADGDSLSSRSHHFGFSVSLSPGKLVVIDSWQAKWQRNKNTFAVSAEVNYATMPRDSNDFARDYNFPIFSLGLKFNRNDVTMHRSPDPAWGMAEEVDYDSRLGNVATLYATFTRPIFRNRRWMFDYMLGTGISYGKHIYDKNDNIDNELTGSRFLIYFTAGLHATWRFADDWGLMGGINYYHHSNGALNRPNKGANFVGPVIGLRYMPYFREFRSSGVQEFRNKEMGSKEAFQKRFYANFALGIGGKTLNEDWQLTQFQTPPGDDDYRTGKFHFYMAYSLQADVMLRYARRWASGIGADLFYGAYADRVKEIDRNGLLGKPSFSKISPWSFGMAVKHNAYYGNLSLRMSLGFYLYRHMGSNAKDIEKPYYERIGLHYAFPRLGGLSIGCNVKAHLTKADFTELVIGYPIAL